MADIGLDIDLYADVETDFPLEDFSTMGSDVHHTPEDLYDDVLTSGSVCGKNDTLDEDENKKLNHSFESEGNSRKRVQLYIGNLTWWTTDQNIADAVETIGVNDFVEVKFYENRANGQSKGFCCVSVGSENSLRLIMEKLPLTELHGQNPVVTYATKQALQQFESQSKTRPSGPVGGPPNRPPSNTPPSANGSTSRPSSSNRPPRVHHGYSRSHPGMRVPPPLTIPPPSLSAIHLPPPLGLTPRGPPPTLGPAPHVNPAFFPPTGPPPHYPHLSSLPGLTEGEFEEIMSRNRTVSSSAIARAVSDAANCEYASAIETLVTAISLIKQSKVATDDRCKILVTSLQDTLVGIENKSYGGSRSRSSRYGVSRRRSYSRERDYHDYYKERSRSRERYRDDKYYDDRYKSREEYRERSRDDLERPRRSSEKDRSRH